VQAAGIRLLGGEIEASALAVVRDGGRLVTITGDPPTAARGITVTAVEVAPDGARLGRLFRLLSDGALSLEVGTPYRLEDASAALGEARGDPRRGGRDPAGLRPGDAGCPAAGGRCRPRDIHPITAPG
jgi:NADPH:quinone reductase-like Zn-dependent oxidoreductase